MSATTYGRASTVWAMNTARRVAGQLQRAERALRDEQQEQEQADEHGRQAEARVGEDLQRAPAAEAPESDREADREPDHAPRIAVAISGDLDA